MNEKVSHIVEWCNHCFKFCRVHCYNRSMCCPVCGKVLGEIGWGRKFNCLQYKRFERIRRMKKRQKRQKHAIKGVDTPCSLVNK